MARDIRKLREADTEMRKKVTARHPLQHQAKVRANNLVPLTMMEAVIPADYSVETELPLPTVIWLPRSLLQNGGSEETPVAQRIDGVGLTAMTRTSAKKGWS